MATTDITHFAPADPSPAHRAADHLAAFFAAVGRLLRNRQATRRLLDLDDRMLRDIGLSRIDVRAALATRFDEDPAYRLTIFSATHSAHYCQSPRRDI